MFFFTMKTKKFNRNSFKKFIFSVASYIISDLCAQGYPDYFAKVPNLFTLDWIYDIIGESGGNVCMSPKFLY